MPLLDASGHPFLSKEEEAMHERFKEIWGKVGAVFQHEGCPFPVAELVCYQIASDIFRSLPLAAEEQFVSFFMTRLGQQFQKLHEAKIAEAKIARTLDQQRKAANETLQ